MTQAPRSTLTIVIPTRNAEEFIVECLASVSWADEVIVVDMFSTDATVEICRRFSNTRVIQREDYIFGNVNHGFELATGDWTMRLDSDERISADLANEIQRMLAHPPDGVTGFFFRQRIIILGHWLRRGRGLNSRREMLFRTGAVRYTVQSEHESLPTDASWREMQGHYIHLNYQSVSQYLRKTDYYTTRDAERLAPNEAPSLARGLIEPARAFYFHYLKRRGFLDGWIGLLDAGMMATYQFVQWAKQREQDAARTSPQLTDDELQTPLRASTS